MQRVWLVFLTSCLAFSLEQLSSDIKCGYLNEEQLLRLGNFAVPTEHQWLARIMYRSGKDKVPTNGCLGVLISKRSVLAPAHCFVQYEYMPDAYSVQLGVWNKSANVLEVNCLDGYCVLPAQELSLTEIAIHPDYDPLTLKHSLAVLTLEKDAELSQNTMPVCMPSLAAANETLVGQLFIVAGFPVAKSLKTKTWVKTISRPWCRSTHQMLAINSNTICGYLQRVEEFHLGAPLVGIERDADAPKNFYLVGLQLEVGRTDVSGRTPATFLAIQPYMEWVTRNAIWT